MNAGNRPPEDGLPAHEDAMVTPPEEDTRPHWEVIAEREEDVPASQERFTRHAFIVPVPRQALRGELALPYGSRGLIVLADICAAADDPAAAALCAALHEERFATLRIGLLHDEECRFADAGEHLPLLTERLLAVVGRLRQQIAVETVLALPTGLVAERGMTPVAVRVAAQRDDDVRALVCHGGLIDLAGLQYLRLLQAPLLFLADAEDEASAANAQRALPHLGGASRLETLADADADERQAQRIAHTVAWFRDHLAP